MDTTKSIDDIFSAKDLVVVITGGGSGIGLAFAAALAKAQASKVYLLGRRVPVLEKAAADIDPAIIKPVECDVTSPVSIRNAVTTIRESTTYVDVLINNAGITGPDQHEITKVDTIEELQYQMLKDWDQWIPTFQTNIAAVVGVSGSFLQLLDEGNKRRGWINGKREFQKRVEGYNGEYADDQRTSQIITISSISGFNRHITAGLAYTATKAGATHIAKSLANLLAPWGIRSNVICPGRFPSEMTTEGPFVFPVTQIPHGVPGEFTDMAGTILYHVGKAGSYLNGNVQILDGGRLSMMPATY